MQDLTTKLCGDPHRIRLPGRRDEFRELADSFDAMLARLETHVAEQQKFAANASHELRTPLAFVLNAVERDGALMEPSGRNLVATGCEWDGPQNG